MWIDKELKKQLISKFQKYKIAIDSFINKKDNKKELYLLIDEKTASSINTIEIIKNCKTKLFNIDYLISNHIHMIMNRIFRSNNRKNEFVSYQMLFYYYESRIARMKYDKNISDNKLSSSS